MQRSGAATYHFKFKKGFLNSSAQAGLGRSKQNSATSESLAKTAKDTQKSCLFLNLEFAFTCIETWTKKPLTEYQ